MSRRVASGLGLLSFLFLCGGSPLAQAQPCLDYSIFPAVLGSEAGPAGPVGDLVVNGNVIYAVSGTELVIFTLDDPLTPVRAGTLDLGDNLRAVCLANDRLFVAVENDGLRIYDVSNPTAPGLLNTVPRLGDVSYEQISGVAAQGDLVAYAEYAQPIRLLDVSDPLAPVELGTVAQTGLVHVAMSGNLLAATGGSARLYDIQDPTLPVELDYHWGTQGCAWESLSYSRPAIHGGRLFTEMKFACNWRNPYLYGDPINPSYTLVILSADKGPVAEKILGGPAARIPRIVGDQLFFAGNPGYHEIHDLIDPAVPFVGYYPLLAELGGLVGVGDRLYAGTDVGLLVTDPPGAYTSDYYLGAGYGTDYQPHQLLAEGDLLLHSYTGTSWVEVGPGMYEAFFIHQVEVRTPEADLGRVTFAADQEWAKPQRVDQAVVADYLYVGSDLGLFATDLSVLDGTAVAVDLAVSEFAAMQSVADHLYLMDPKGGVRILSLDDPMSPVDLGPWLSDVLFEDMVAQGNNLYLRTGSTLRVADVSTPTAPVLRAGDVTVPAGRMKISEGHLLITLDDGDGGSRLTWYSLTAEGGVTAVGSMDLARDVKDVVISKDRIYYTDEVGVGLIDLLTGQDLGRVMVREAMTVALWGDGLQVAQRSQWNSFEVPLDCADPVPVFLEFSEVRWLEEGGALSWEVNGQAQTSSFQVEATCGSESRDLDVLQASTRLFRAVAPADFKGEIRFTLYLTVGPDRVLLNQKTLSPLPGALATELASVHPNPFNPRTEITYRVKVDEPVEVSVYDLSGRRLKVLATGLHAAGEYTVVWGGQDAAGRSQASGSYMVRLESGSRVDSRKLLLLR